MSTSSGSNPTGTSVRVATPQVEARTSTATTKAQQATSPNMAPDPSADPGNIAGGLASNTSISSNPSDGEADKQTNPNALTKDNSEGVWARMKAFAKKFAFVIGGVGLLCGAALAAGVGGLAYLSLVPIAAAAAVVGVTCYAIYKGAEAAVKGIKNFFAKRKERKAQLNGGVDPKKAPANSLSKNAQTKADFLPPTKALVVPPISALQTHSTPTATPQVHGSTAPAKTTTTQKTAIQM